MRTRWSIAGPRAMTLVSLQEPRRHRHREKATWGPRQRAEPCCCQRRTPRAAHSYQRLGPPLGAPRTVSHPVCRALDSNPRKLIHRPRTVTTVCPPSPENKPQDDRILASFVRCKVPGTQKRVWRSAGAHSSLNTS